MSDQAGNEKPSPGDSRQTVDAIRHVGPTLEAEGLFVPTGELPENRIENEASAETGNRGAVTADRYDREADAMGAEPLRTRLPGDTSSDPHTDENPAASRKSGPGRNRAA